ncbi:MAG: aldehyde ferredoxin oxidoreductase family protein [Peptococcaceae bacterium]|nr:aldehyde ferredoxin oxidoreductase family protein [Peptococcaceae bacterium]
MNGYAGNILRVDLTNRVSRIEPLPEELADNFIGGRGFVAKLMWDEIPAGADPLGPDNKIIMAPGPLTGAFLPGAGKLEFGAKSPASGGYGDSNVGGHISPEIKQAGFDAIIISGQASTPVYLLIDDFNVAIHEAGHLWGKGAIETETALKHELGEQYQICTIGPAGENKVLFACISHDFGRQAGRTGIATVMGSKNLKAIAVHGTKGIPLADPKATLAKGKEMFAACFAKPGFEEWTPQGTAGVTDWVNEVGAFPTRNFQTSYFPQHKNINGEALVSKIKVTDKACFACPIPCGKYSRVKRPGYDVYVEGPEYETIALIGGNTEIDNIEDCAFANYIVDELGLDSISAGNVIGFAMECSQKGIITAEDLGGRTLNFGSVDDFVWVAEAIAHRRGIGAILADGVKRAAAHFGQGSERFAIHVKGVEWTGYEARYAPAMMLSYMTADVGAHHNRSWAITFDVASGRDKLEGKAKRVIELQHIRPLFDMLCLCRLQWVELGFELDWYPQIFQAVTGKTQSFEELLKFSERVWNLTRAYSLREIPGFGRDFDYPPRRFMEEPIPDGPAAGKVMPREVIDRLLDEYYDLRGWDQRGIPSGAKLAEMGLDFVEGVIAPLRS